MVGPVGFEPTTTSAPGSPLPKWGCSGILWAGEFTSPPGPS